MLKEQASSFHSHMHPNVRKNITSKQRRIDTDSMCWTAPASRNKEINKFQ